MYLFLLGKFSKARYKYKNRSNKKMNFHVHNSKFECFQ